MFSRMQVFDWSRDGGCYFGGITLKSGRRGFAVYRDGKVVAQYTSILNPFTGRKRYSSVQRVKKEFFKRLLKKKLRFVIMKAKTAKTIILIIGVAIILSGFALFFLEQYWLKLPLLVLLLLLGVVVFVAFRRKPDFWPFVFGVGCTLQALWYCDDFYRGNNGALYSFPPPMPNWYLIIQLLLCLFGIYLTIKWFNRKKKGQEFKVIAWIPLVVSVVFCIAVHVYYML